MVDDNKIKRTFARRLKEFREAAGLSQAELGEMLGVSRGSISFYEAGDRTPDIVFLRRTADFFKVSADYLLGMTETEMPPTADLYSAQKITGLRSDALAKLETKKSSTTTSLLSEMIESEEFDEFLHYIILYLELDKDYVKKAATTEVLKILFEKLELNNSTQPEENNLSILQTYACQSGAYTIQRAAIRDYSYWHRGYQYDIYSHLTKIMKEISMKRTYADEKELINDENEIVEYLHTRIYEILRDYDAQGNGDINKTIAELKKEIPTIVKKTLEERISEIEKQ